MRVQCVRTGVSFWCVVALSVSAPALARQATPATTPASGPPGQSQSSQRPVPPAAPVTYGFYYKEVRKDDHIYVFNRPEDAARFEKTGEMKRALTRPGTGPNGETVVGDSERALQLFYFKHGLSEPVADPVTPLQRVEWRDGKTRITTDLAYLEISNRIQTRYTHEFPDSAVRLPGTGGAGDSRGSFRMRRAKLKLEGWLWKPPGAATGHVTLPHITYEVQLNWPAVTGANPGALLEDAYIGIDPTGQGTFRVLFGQFKVPFGRQELTSSGNLSLVDRTLVSNEYARGRDTGVAIQGATRNNRLEYRFGVFNGNGLTRTTNDNASVQVNGRVMWQPNGATPLAQRAWVSGPLYSEADFESTTTPIYAVALNYEHNDFHRTTAGNDFKADVVGIDGVYKFKGVFAAAEYFLRRRTPEIGAKYRADGGFGQVGVMLNRDRSWEAAFRYGSRDVNDTVGNDTIKEIRAGLNYYYRRHSLKFQIDGGVVETGLAAAGGKRKDAELRTQAQFIF